MSSSIIPQCVQSAPLYTSMHEEMNDAQIVAHVPDMYRFWEFPPLGDDLLADIDPLIAIICAHEYWLCECLDKDILRPVDPPVVLKLVEHFGDENIFVKKFVMISELAHLEHGHTEDVLDEFSAAVKNNHRDVVDAIYRMPSINNRMMLRLAMYGDAEMIATTYPLNMQCTLDIASINSDRSKSYMFSAIKYGNIHFIKYCCDRGLKLKLSDLALAVKFRRLECVKYLCKCMHLVRPVSPRFTNVLFGPGTSQITPTDSSSTRLEMYKYLNPHNDPVSDEHLQLIARSSSVEMFKYIVDDRELPLIISCIRYINYADVLKYVVSKVGVDIVLGQMTDLMERHITYNRNPGIIEYVCSIGYVPTQLDIARAATAFPDKLEVLLRYGSATDPVIRTYNVNCIKILHASGRKLRRKCYSTWLNASLFSALGAYMISYHR